MNNYLPFIIFIVSVICVNCAYIENNAYKGISISFSPKVQLLRLDFEKLKNILKNASQILYHATRRRSYFGEFVFSVPSTWTSDDVCESFTQKAPQGIDIYVTDIPTISELKTQHSKTCGKSGDVIYMPQFWYNKGDTRDLARQFVQQWSIFRYGVFEEHSESSGACFASSKNVWSPVGCYNTQFNPKVQFDDSGIPQCYFSDDFFQNDNFNSSLMTFHNLSEVVHFCDGTKKYPHNPIMPTLHNNLCHGRNTWSIIQNSEDFANGRNSSRSDEELKEKTTFRCFKEPVIQVTFAIQNSTYKTSKDNEYKAFLETIVELRYALLHFLSNMAPKESIVNLLTFSDAAITEAGNSVQLDLSKKEELEAVLDNRIGMEDITKICFLCGLRKALNVSQTKDHPFPIVVLIAWESALVGEKISDLTEELQKYPDVVFHLILVEDTNSDVLPSTFVDAVRRTRGQIFNLAKEMVMMSTELNQALASVFKSPLHIEDSLLVLHQKTYFNIKSNIVDAFATQSGAMGELLYMMHCNDNDMISSMNVSCETWDQKSSTFKCGEISSLTDNKSPHKVWAYSFKYSIRPIPLICSSIAMLKVTSTSDNSFTLRGWLNEDKITPGYNVLIIYAEVIKQLDQDFRVEARISGPKLDSIPIELRDNGNGDPDVKKGDNIYSRYFTSYVEKGTYSVTIYAETLNGKQEKWLAEGDADKFSQTKVIGSFTVMESAPTIDIYPPNKIGDLKLLSVNNLNRTVTLQWTAPGNDYDSGNAMNYELKYSNHWTNLLEIAFEEEGMQLDSISEHAPLPSGETETFATTFPNIAGNVFVALRARDDKQNVAMVSNIIQVYIMEEATTTFQTFKTDISDKLPTITPSTLSNTKETSETISDDTESSTDTTDVPTPTSSLNMDDYVKKSFVIIVIGSVAGGILLLIIVINVIVYYCCLKKYKKSKPPKHLSRRASLRPPFNLNVAYRESKSSYNTEQELDGSINSLPEQYPDPRARSSQRRYSYHTSRSLLEQKKSSEKDLGFKLVQTMPAYATTSLSRVRNYDNGSDQETKGAISQPQRPKSAVDAQIYPLGIV